MHRCWLLTRRILFAMTLLAAPPGWAGKLDLQGAEAVLAGSHKMVFKDDGGSSRLTCPAQDILGDLSFEAGRIFHGEIDDRPVAGVFKQKAPGGRKLVFKLDAASLAELNQGIDDFVSSCIWSIPDGKPLKFKDVRFKGKINQARDALVVKGVVKFTSKEVGIFWDMRGDTSDTWTLKLKGPLSFPPIPAE